MSPTIRASVTHGKLTILDMPRYTTWVSRLDGLVELIIRKPVKKRSLNENRYYHGVIVKMISDHTGSSPEDVHQFLKRKFLPDGGVIIPRTRSTTELTTVEAEKYYEEIRRWAAMELSLFVPQPNEIDFSNLSEAYA